MAEVFLSYSHVDRGYVDALALALRRRGLVVWFDEGLQAGERYDQKLEDKLRQASAVIVVWSSASVRSKWVRAEAAAAYEEGKLLPVLSQRCDIPLPFNTIHSETLSFSDLKADSALLDRLVAELPRVEARVAGNRRPTPVSEAALLARLELMAAQDPDAPGDFIAEMEFPRPKLTYYPVAVGVYVWRASVSATLIYSRTESYTDYVDEYDYQSKQTRRVPVSRTRTVPDPRPYAGLAEGRCRIQSPAGAAPPQVAQFLRRMRIADAFQRGEIPAAADIVTHTLDGRQVAENEKAAIEGSVHASIVSALPHHNYENLRWNISEASPQIEYVYAPVYTGEVRYKERGFPYIVSGLSSEDSDFDVPQDTELAAKLAERKAAANSSVWLTVLFAVAGAAVLAVSAWLEGEHGSVGGVAWAIALAAWGIGGIAAALAVLGDAKRTREVFQIRLQNAQLRTQALLARPGHSQSHNPEQIAAKPDAQRGVWQFGAISLAVTAVAAAFYMGVPSVLGEFRDWNMAQRNSDAQNPPATSLAPSEANDATMQRLDSQSSALEPDMAQPEDDADQARAPIDPPESQIAEPDAPRPEASPAGFIDPPIWTVRPNGRHLVQYYPPRALERSQTGEVVLECLIADSGQVACSVTNEEPAGWGFGEAAVMSSQHWRHAVQLPSGASAVGAKVHVTVNFRTMN